MCAYNVERGLRLDDQLTAVTAADTVPAPDILLLSEADRGCSRSGNRNVARDYAAALGMYYVYGVEFVELPRLWGPGGGRVRQPCEHGNAIVSRYPLGNVRLIRHADARSWHSRTQRFLRVGQPRLGGRVALAADVRVGDRLLRVYAVHFESGRLSVTSSDRSRYRVAQARELIDDAADLEHGVIIGGDMNVVDYRPAADGRPTDDTMASLFEAGYVDAHAAVSASERPTSDSGKIIDLIVGRNMRFHDAGVGPPSTWAPLSDHVPVWARVELST